MTITVQHGKDDITTHEDSERWHIDEDGRLHIVGDSGNVASYNEGYWANVIRGSVKPPEGYEFQETSFAKNHAMDALETALEKQGIDPYDEDRGIELIDLADAVVEALLKAGLIIPEDISNPHAVKNS